jgi:hypothetical protein
MSDPLPQHVWEITIQVRNGDWRYTRTGPTTYDNAVRLAVDYRAANILDDPQIVSIAKLDPPPADPTRRPSGADVFRAIEHGSRFRNALAIVDPGACNPSGIAHSIVEACREIREHEPQNRSTDAICADPALRLMVYQLGSLIPGMYIDNTLYSEDVAYCKIRLAELGLKPFGT